MKSMEQLNKIFKRKYKKSILAILMIALIFILLGNFNKVWAQAGVVELGPATMGQLDTLLGGINANTAGETVATNVGKAIVRFLIKKVFDKLANQIIEWAQSGFEGAPLFIQDPEAFLKTYADESIGFILSTFVVNLCEISNPYITLFMSTSKFDDAVTCTLSEGLKNIEDITNKLLDGSWAEWVKLTQIQNNPYGAAIMMMEKAVEEANAEQETKKTEMISGQGYLGVKICKIKSKRDGRCLKYQTESPGVLVSGLVTKSMTRDQDWLLSADEIGEYITAIADAATYGLIKLAKGKLTDLVLKDPSSSVGAFNPTFGFQKPDITFGSLVSSYQQTKQALLDILPYYSDLFHLQIGTYFLYRHLPDSYDVVLRNGSSYLAYSIEAAYNTFFKARIQEAWGRMRSTVDTMKTYKKNLNKIDEELNNLQSQTFEFQFNIGIPYKAKATIETTEIIEEEESSEVSTSTEEIEIGRQLEIKLKFEYDLTNLIKLEQKIERIEAKCENFLMLYDNNQISDDDLVFDLDNLGTIEVVKVGNSIASSSNPLYALFTSKEEKDFTDKEYQALITTGELKDVPNILKQSQFPNPQVITDFPDDPKKGIFVDCEKDINKILSNKLSDKLRTKITALRIRVIKQLKNDLSKLLSKHKENIESLGPAEESPEDFNERVTEEYLKDDDAIVPQAGNFFYGFNYKQSLKQYNCLGGQCGKAKYAAAGDSIKDEEPYLCNRQGTFGQDLAIGLNTDFGAMEVACRNVDKNKDWKLTNDDDIFLPYWPLYGYDFDKAIDYPNGVNNYIINNASTLFIDKLGTDSGWMGFDQQMWKLENIFEDLFINSFLDDNPDNDYYMSGQPCKTVYEGGLGAEWIYWSVAERDAPKVFPGRLECYFK